MFYNSENGLTVGSLVLRGCTALTCLPEGLLVYFLDIAGCTGLTGWPWEASVQMGRLDASGCTQLTELPPGLRVTSWIDVADTQISAVPAASQGVQLCWRGVPVDERIAFCPGTITASEVLAAQTSMQTCRQAAAWVAGFDDPAAYRPLVET